MNIEIKVPDIGPDTVEVTEILVKIGEKVKKEDGLIVIEGQKSSMEVPAPTDGIVKDIKIKLGSKISTGTLIMIFEINDHVLVKEETDINLNDIHASPLIRRLAREKKINLKDIIGTGPKKRILKEDLQNYIKNEFMLKDMSADVKTNISIPLSDTVSMDNTNNKYMELSHIQIISGKNLSKSWKQIPHVTQFYESDITELEEFRKNYNMKYKNNGINITILIFIIKIVSYALKKFPKFNSTLSNDKKQLILKSDVNIGVAVDSSKGVLVPVLKNLDSKNISDISKELNCLSNQVKKGTISLLDMQGAGFTISNLGCIGGCGFTPIINMFEVGILGISRACVKPIWNGKEFIPRLILPMSLSYDHRVVDGVYAVSFLKIISELLLDIRLIVMN